jgi:hypothetical protein
LDFPVARGCVSLTLTISRSRFATCHRRYLNRDILIHASANLRVFLKVTSSNTAAPAMMIGERAAAFIKEDWGAASTQWYGKASTTLWKVGDTSQYH